MTDAPSSGSWTPEHDNVTDDQYHPYPTVRRGNIVECFYCTHEAVDTIETPWGPRPVCLRHDRPGGRL